MRDTGGNRLNQVRALRNGTTAREVVGGGDRQDIYRLTLTEASRLRVTVRGSSHPVRLELLQDYNGNGRFEPHERVGRSRPPRKVASLQRSNLAAGTFFLRVLPQNGRETRYQLRAIAHPIATSHHTSPEQTTATSTNPSFIDQVVNLTNAFRQQFGLQPLSPNPSLSAAAQEHSRNMAIHDFFDHTGIDGSQPWDRITEQGYQWLHAAENIAAGQQTPESVVNGWMNSPGHRQNILNANLREIGVGYYELRYDLGQVNYGRYWTQTFGAMI